MPSGEAIVCIALSLAFAGLAQANVPDSNQICLETDNSSLTLDAETAWTVVRLTYAGCTITDASVCGSGQGTVIKSDGVWVGSIHGGETVLSTELIADGQECEIFGGTTFNGSDFYFRKESSLGGIVNLTAEMWFDSNKITEKHHYVILGDEHEIGVFYTFLNSHSDTMTDWCMQDANEAVYSGQVSFDANQAIVAEHRAVKVGQYDPTSRQGVATVYESGFGNQGKSFIWNRVCDNKLYFRYYAGEGRTDSGAQMWACQTRHFFECDPNEYQSVALGFEPGDTRKYKSDVNNDGVVDHLDLAVFANEWLRQQPWYIPFFQSSL